MKPAVALATTSAPDRVSPTEVASLEISQPETDRAIESREIALPRKSTKNIRAESPISGTALPVYHPHPVQDNAFMPLGEWQGYVTKLEADRFHATMDGVFGQGIAGKRHDAIIPLAEVSPEDARLVREGAYFRLSVSYTVTRGGTGTSTRQSSIVFRRLPAYRSSEIAEARDLARELLGGIRLE